LPEFEFVVGDDSYRNRDVDIEFHLAPARETGDDSEFESITRFDFGFDLVAVRVFQGQPWTPLAGQRSLDSIPALRT
jgi:hypothetical protein